MERDGLSDTKCSIHNDQTRGTAGDTFDWVQGRDKTPSADIQDRKINGTKFPVTGPSGARQGTYYIYTEGTGRRRNDVARLLLEGSDFQVRGDNCLRFWYVMNGFHVGALHVCVRLSNGQKHDIWTLHGDLGPSWQRANIDINMDSVSQLIIEAEMTDHFSDDFGLDDLSITHGHCQENNHSPFLWACSFESANGNRFFCRLEQDKEDSFDWLIHSGGTSSYATGPIGAHSGTFYLYAEASSPRKQGDVARFWVPNLNHYGPICVDFYYHMYGHHMGRLSVILRSSGDTENIPLWKKSGDQSTSWHQERVSVKWINRHDQIGFMAERGTSYTSDVALDTILVKAGAC